MLLADRLRQHPLERERGREQRDDADAQHQEGQLQHQQVADHRELRHHGVGPAGSTGSLTRFSLASSASGDRMITNNHIRITAHRRPPHACIGAPRADPAKPAPARPAAGGRTGGRARRFRDHSTPGPRRAGRGRTAPPGARRRRSAPARPRGARPGSQLTVGLVVPSSTFYYTDVIRGAEAMADRYGARLVLGVSGYDVARRAGADRQGARHRRRRAAAQHRARRRRRGRDRPPPRRDRRTGRPDGAGVRLPGTSPREYDHVRTDHAYGAMLALRHLVSLGHRRIGINLNASVTAYWLRQGIEEAAGSARRRDLFVSPRRTARAAATTRPRSPSSTPSWPSARPSAPAPRLVHSDEHAARLVERAMERGLRVPGRPGRRRYNDETAALAVVPLTAVCPPKFALGQTACELLLRRTPAGPGRPHRPPST